MSVDSAAATAEPRPESSRHRPAPVRPAPEFPGCHTIPFKREDLPACDERFEYWDTGTETAWVVSDFDITH